MANCLIILDAFEYKSREDVIANELSGIVNPHLFYTTYENGLTRIFQRTKIIGGFFTHLTYWIMSFGYACQLLDSKYKKYDYIIFINPIVGIFYGLLSRVFHIKSKMSVGGFLFESKTIKFYEYLRKVFVNVSYKNIDKIFVYGENEVDHYGQIFPRLQNKFCYVKYGRDFIYSDKKDFNHDKQYIASGGRSNRNFKTLCDAINLLHKRGEEIDCLIATRPECVNNEINQSDVDFVYGITLNQFGSFIEHSTLFVLPLKNTTLSAGHMAMMEAMANSRPIIVTDIPAIRDYVSENHVTFYRPDDAIDLANKIEFILNNRSSEEVRSKILKGKVLYEGEYSFKALLKRIVIESVK